MNDLILLCAGIGIVVFIVKYIKFLSMMSIGKKIAKRNAEITLREFRKGNKK